MNQPGPQVFLASRNVKKIEEMRRILGEQLGADASPGHVPAVVVLGLDDVVAYAEPVEDQPSFEGNALLKARAGLHATGLPSLADDSGLCVDALNGMPGVLSARWSGPVPEGSTSQADERNNALLLDQLADVPDERRGAQFCCAVAFCHPDGTEQVTHGVMRGRVIRELRGTNGFGYDVLFVPDDQEPDEGATAGAAAGSPGGAAGGSAVGAEAGAAAGSTAGSWRDRRGDPGGSAAGSVAGSPGGSAVGSEWGLTSAEMTSEAKDRISHRGQALRAIAPVVLATLR